METVVTPPAESKETFDVGAYLKNANLAEQAKREGKPAPTPAPAAAAVEPKPPETPPMTRAQRRAANRLHEELGAERARRELAEAENARLKAGGAAAAPKPVDADPEPKRAHFATDAEHQRALGQWDARQEVKKEIGKTVSAAEGQQALAARLKEADAEFKQDLAETPGLKEAFEAIAEDEDAPKIDWGAPENGTLTILLSTSKAQAAMALYLTEHPDQMEKLIGLNKKPADQIELWHSLEVRAIKALPKLLDKGKKKPDNSEEGKKKPTVAELDAAKAKPSEANAPKGGVATDGAISPTMPDGKTLNPAWKAQRNARDGVRQ